MNKKVFFFIIFAGIFFAFGVLGESLEDSYTGISLIFVVAVICFQFISYKFYTRFIGYTKESITKGLFYSLILGIILLFFIMQGDHNYTRQVAENITSSGSYFGLIYVALILILSFFCFIFDAFFNKEIKNIEKWKVGLGSILFYGLNYVVSFAVAIILSVSQALGFG